MLSEYSFKEGIGFDLESSKQLNCHSDDYIFCHNKVLNNNGIYIYVCLEKTINNSTINYSGSESDESPSMHLIFFLSLRILSREGSDEVLCK